MEADHAAKNKPADERAHGEDLSEYAHTLCCFSKKAT
jgi:hypothetical protein